MPRIAGNHDLPMDTTYHGDKADKALPPISHIWSPIWVVIKIMVPFWVPLILLLSAVLH